MWYTKSLWAEPGFFSWVLGNGSRRAHLYAVKYPVLACGRWDWFIRMGDIGRESSFCRYCGEWHTENSACKEV